MHCRDVWIKHFGEIPKDEQGRSFEIHHLDGDKNNNSIENLICISIEEHYKIHYDRGDWSACVLIAKRMSLPSDYVSSIQQGVKRPGVGGVKKGTVPWNKDVKGYKLILTEEGKRRKKQARPPCTISDADVRLIRKQYADRVFISDRVGIVSKNGRPLSYERAFSRHYAKIYNVSPVYIDRIIKNKSRKDVQT